ncbi:ABC transporter ATP-binding protein [Planctomyces sp. SH-PL62]|uniref:ABC transporter ATP-binding protein n=1 Tax=Planctomyces sp. SH-PL62 TaxID=1636152 RepID=UPI00078DC406|nr:ABC transporter ATP-binding protein [Planctomyces sp. SH-PL62]AMV36851.1 Putative multidrug export ATP-binding/permease protein [Planctomyces sp. SH-PL62]
MKNFVRLVRFAWPYRYRFGISVACALMVALLAFMELGAVLPLLKILINNDNPQRWISTKIDSIAEDIERLAAQREELERVERAFAAGGNLSAPLSVRFQELEKVKKDIQTELESRERRVALPDQPGASSQVLVEETGKIQLLKREQRIIEARWSELSQGSRWLHESDRRALDRRVAAIDRERKNEEWWQKLYQGVKPTVYEYLPSDQFRTLGMLMGLVLIGVMIKGCFTFCQEVLVADVMQRTLFDVRNLFFRRTTNLDLASFSEQGSSDLMARFTNDMDWFGQGLNTILSKLIREPLRAVICMSGAFWFNWRLTCLTLVVVPISAYTTYRVGRVMKRAVRRSLESMSSIYKILQETFQGIKVVKAFGMERVERRRFFLETKNFYKKSIRVAMIDSMSDPVLELLTLITVAIALLSGSYLVLKQSMFLEIGPFKLQLASEVMAIEDLLTLYAIMAGVSDPIRKLSNVHSKLQRAAAASDRICALMDREPQVAESPQAVLSPAHRRTIEFDGVHFSYPGRDSLLQGITLTVHHGETVALVGPNGCGKSTLMNLLPRFWDVDSGAIRIDGVDVREIRGRSLRRMIGIVPQETILFQDSIARNIAYGDPGANRDAIVKAAERSYAHQFIMTLPDGYDTVIGERGHGLSGGQRQRIALARAMLRDPSILILDEATSAVDIQDEALIRKAIEEFSRGRTTFLISHSMGTIQFADRIVLIDDGRIAAVGTDQELKRSSPLYRRLHDIHYHRESA